MLPPIGNIFERHGHLSMILYKKGPFKISFSNFNKKNPSFPEEEKWNKKCSNSKEV